MKRQLNANLKKTDEIDRRNWKKPKFMRAVNVACLMGNCAFSYRLNKTKLISHAQVLGDNLFRLIFFLKKQNRRMMKTSILIETIFFFKYLFFAPLSSIAIILLFQYFFSNSNSMYIPKWIRVNKSSVGMRSYFPKKKKNIEKSSEILHRKKCNVSFDLYRFHLLYAMEYVCNTRAHPLVSSLIDFILIWNI